jgi:hypothetical protein
MLRVGIVYRFRGDSRNRYGVKGAVVWLLPATVPAPIFSREKRLQSVLIASLGHQPRMMSVPPTIVIPGLGDQAASVP